MFQLGESYIRSFKDLTHVLRIQLCCKLTEDLFWTPLVVF